MFLPAPLVLPLLHPALCPHPCDVLLSLSCCALLGTCTRTNPCISIIPAPPPPPPLFPTFHSAIDPSQSGGHWGFCSPHAGSLAGKQAVVPLNPHKTHLIQACWGCNPKNMNPKCLCVSFQVSLRRFNKLLLLQGVLGSLCSPSFRQHSSAHPPELSTQPIVLILSATQYSPMHTLQYLSVLYLQCSTLFSLQGSDPVFLCAHLILIL